MRRCSGPVRIASRGRFLYDGTFESIPRTEQLLGDWFCAGKHQAGGHNRLLVLAQSGSCVVAPQQRDT